MNLSFFLKYLTGSMLLILVGCINTYEFASVPPGHPANTSVSELVHIHSETLVHSDPVDPQPAQSNQWTQQNGGGEHHHNHGNMIKSEKDQQSENYSSRVSDDFKEEFTGLTGAYLSIKDALIESDFEQVLHYSSEAGEILVAIGQHRLEGQAHMAWMDTYANLTDLLNLMKEAKNLDESRAQFQQLSALLIDAVKSFGIDGVVYHQYCSMEKASWLSSEIQIQNPYQPEMMLSCGEIIEKIE